MRRQSDTKSPATVSTVSEVSMNSSKSSKSLTKYTLSEPNRNLAPHKYRAGYVRILRSDMYILASQGTRCNVYFYVFAAAEYFEKQGEFNWENDGKPTWNLITGYREIARHTNLHPETVRRALKYLEKQDFVKVRCDSRRLIISVVNNWDSFKNEYAGVTGANTQSVTVGHKVQPIVTMDDPRQLPMLSVTVRDTKTGPSVTLRNGFKGLEFIGNILPKRGDTVTRLLKKCDRYLVLNTKVYSSTRPNLFKTYLADLAATQRLNELKAFTKLQSGKGPLSRSDVDMCFDFVNAGAGRTPPEVGQFLAANIGRIKPLAQAFYQTVAPGAELTFYDRTLKQFCDRYVTAEDQERALRRLREQHSDVICWPSDLGFVRLTALWVWSILGIGENDPSPAPLPMSTASLAPASSALTPDLSTDIPTRGP